MPSINGQRFEGRFSGEGGQGVVLGGSILAEAAILYDNKYAVQSPTYGSRVRGGPTRVDVIISNNQIIYPRATRIDFFLALAQMAYDKYRGDLADDAIILVDQNLVPRVNEDGRRVYRLPIVETAKELGNVVLSNVIALGAMQELTGVVSVDGLWKSIESRVPKHYLDMNRRAMELGIEQARVLKDESLRIIIAV